MKINLGDLLWHPCSIDIMEHKVIGIHTYEGFAHIKTKATHNIGACGKVECILDVRKDKCIFVELVDDIEYSSGLKDFVEGEYFFNKQEARKAFYDIQMNIAQKNMDEKRRWYEDAKKRFEQIEKIISEIDI